jgi:hypothetical protein
MARFDYLVLELIGERFHEPGRRGVSSGSGYD